MRAIVITVGDEILSGRTLDTNFAHLGRRLLAEGHEVVRHLTVPDRIDPIRDAVHAAVAEAVDIIVVTGGLGGTPDDITLDAVASALGRPLADSPEILRRLEAGYRARGIAMPELNRRIARLVEGARPIANPVGQAPGQYLVVGEGRGLLLLPGVPPEMKAIFESALATVLAPAAGGEAPPVRVLTFRTVGLAESVLAQALADRGVSGLAFLPGVGQVDVCLRIAAGAGGSDETARAISIIREVTGDALLGDDRVTLEDAVGQCLIDRGETVAVAESISGGGLSSRIVRVPGASRYFRGGVIAYANELKERWLGVSASSLEAHGAASAEVAAEMAAGARERAGAHWGLSTTGIAGPSGATEGKPVGLVYIGLAFPGGRVHVVRHLFAGDRRLVTRRATSAALDLLRRGLGELALPQ